MAIKHVATIAAEIDETDRFPLKIVKLFGEMGLMQLWVPEQYGGPNGKLSLACLAREEIAKISPACASIACLNTMFIMPLLHFGSEEQRGKFLPIIARGGVVTAIAISEPQAGSDVTAINTRAKKDGDCYVLNGRKQWCSYGVVADFIVVMARTSDSSGADGISAFIVEPKTMPGISFGRHERKMGFRGAPNTPIFFDNVRVPVENLVERKARVSAPRCAPSTSTVPPSALSPSGWLRAPSMSALPMRRSVSSSRSRSLSFRACSSCWRTWPCRSKLRARSFMNARALATGSVCVLASMAKCVGSDMAKLRHLEGILAKRADSPYASGRRTADWLKVKTTQRQEVVIARFTAPRRTRPFFGAFVLAVRDDDTWRYIGHVGTGFSHQVLEELHSKLVRLKRTNSPFPAKVKDERVTTGCVLRWSLK
jgi:hypothetical protein